MRFSLSNRALLRGMMAGAAVLTGTACHRSDRTESGRDSSAAVLPDTSSTAAQPSGAGTTTRAVSDTATTSAQPSTPAPSNTPRAKTAAPSDKDAVGYRSMERDTTNVASQHSDSARVTADTADVSSASSDTSLSQTSSTASQTSSAADSAAIDASADVAASTSTEMAGAADTTAAGYSEMARDTSTVADQVDTAAAANGEVALKTSIDTSSQADADVSADAGAADTTGNAGRIRPPEDSTEILGEVRVRPPEESTEILGNVTTDEAADETADEQVVRPEDRVTVAAAETPTDEVGAAAMGGNVTGEDAVALMTREGLRCAVVDPETNEAVRWDMSSTPVSLNPCGMGSMILSRIWTAGQRDGGTAGQ